MGNEKQEGASTTMLEPNSMKTFVKINSFGALTHDESRVRHDQDVPRRVDRVWVVNVE